MAAAVASTKAASRTASRLFSPRKSALGLQVHKQLYPHLYQDGNIPKSFAPNPAKQLADGHVKRISDKSSNAEDGVLDAPRKLSRFDKPASRQRKHTSGIMVYPPKPSTFAQCPFPVAAVTNSQIALHDPTGARTRLFAKTNPEGARVGDILLVRQRTGDPFAGVCINIRRQGIDTAILLRGQLTRVGVEMWYKVYSPLVEGIEVVQRAAKRARRARLTYMRTVKHDRGSVENVVRVYLRQKAALGTADGKKKAGMAAAAAAGGKKGKGRGKKR
ncbi:translation protein SH3-like domain-containing protein [Dendryphion nanum]|uniref:Translation protein SH3-like domain-containing protein n=1 Tax=Dendryphion nanum TaxID=256645 RepID=A0A9P9IYC1_9PLEO|nr:translation protein SH3-like domain-containing protein [Dendryphion nanum]